MAELKASLEFAHAEVLDTKEQLASLKSSIKNNNEQHQQLQPAVTELARRLDYMDDQGRKVNLRFCGIPEQPHETQEQAQVKVMRLLQSKLNTSPDIQVAHRIGKPSASKPRDILAKFRSVNDRDAVHRKRTAMKGTNIFINEDLCPGTVAARQAQMQQYHDARRAGKQVYWNYRKLVVRDFSPRRPSQHQGRPTPSPPATVTTTYNNPTTSTSTATPSNNSNTNSTRESPVQPSPTTTSTTEFPCLVQQPNETLGATRPDTPSEPRRADPAEDSGPAMEQRVLRSAVQ